MASSLRFMGRLGFLWLMALAPLHAAKWNLTKSQNTELPGEAVTVTRDGQRVARFIYGEGQQLPYLALYDDRGNLVTNSGINQAGEAVGQYPHHRGIFIGWARIRSDLGVANLWGMSGGTKMEVVAIEKLATTAQGATVAARVQWHAPTKDASGQDLLLTETRQFELTRSNDGTTQVDVTSRLQAARDLVLDGDVQHAGIHCRVSHVVGANHAKETSYLWSPATAEGQAGKVVSPELQWGELLFPLHGRWYRILQLSSPRNPVEEFSIRDYGRFGFFFKKELKKDEALSVAYRFILQATEPPAQAPQRSPAQIAQARARAEAEYARYAR